MALKTIVVALSLILSATTILLAQSLPNYGPNAPATGDSFGKPPSGVNPPGVTRSGRNAYAYQQRPYRHPHPHRHWRHWY
jgi:hypothetical protein